MITSKCSFKKSTIIPKKSLFTTDIASNNTTPFFNLKNVVRITVIDSLGTVVETKMIPLSDSKTQATDYAYNIKKEYPPNYKVIVEPTTNTVSTDYTLKSSTVQPSPQLNDDTCTTHTRECPETMMSLNNKCKVIMQADGNLVLSNHQNKSLWKSGIKKQGKAPFKYALQGNGNLVVYDSVGTSTWESGTAGKGIAPFKSVIQDDCNFVLYSANGPSWASNTIGRQDE